MFTKIYNMYKDKSEKEFKYKKENVINELLKISFKLKNIIKNNNKNNNKNIFTRYGPFPIWLFNVFIKYIF